MSILKKMTPLTKTAILTRKIIRYGFYALVLLIIGRITLNLGLKLYQYFFPPPPPPPTVSFGKLSKIPFPEKEFPGDLTFRLETPEGDLPNFPDQAKVYFMPRVSPSLLSLDVAKKKASSLGFSTDAKKVTESVYIFSHPRAPTTLRMNIISGSFSISYDLRESPEILEVRPPSPEVAASSVRNYLSSAGLLKEDLSGPVTHEFLRIEENNFVKALSLSEANFVKINLFRREFDNLPSLTDNPNEANVWFLLSGERLRERQFIAAEYHYLPVNEERFETYPIKTAQVAWEELKSGNAYIANVGQAADVKNVTIRRVYLAYYDPSSATEFYQPVVVFEEGVEGGFSAYVPAVISEYYGE